MTEDDSPDPRFVGFLEWELRSTMRRRERADRRRWMVLPVQYRLAATLALVVASLFVGGAGTYAATHRVDEQAAALNLSRCEAFLEIARTRLNPVADEYTHMQALVKQGSATEQELLQVETKFLYAESEVRSRELDLAETRITGKGPNDALSSPLVEGRDFVSERLATRLKPIRMRVHCVTDQAQRIQQLRDAGLVHATEQTAIEMQVAAAEEELMAMEKRVSLRESFLAGKLTPAAVGLEDMRITAESARRTTLRQISTLAEKRGRLSTLVEKGMISNSELQSVEGELRAAEAQAKIAELELGILDQKVKEESSKSK